VRGRIEVKGDRGETAGSHAEVEDGGTGVAIAADGEGRGRVVELKANSPHQLEEADFCSGVGVVGAFALVLKVGVPRLVFPALAIWVSGERDAGLGGGLGHRWKRWLVLAFLWRSRRSR
jgi:hypothetical protein